MLLNSNITINSLLSILYREFGKEFCPETLIWAGQVDFDAPYGHMNLNLMILAAVQLNMTLTDIVPIIQTITQKVKSKPKELNLAD